MFKKMFGKDSGSAKSDGAKEFSAKPTFGRKGSVKAAFDEVDANPPAILAKTAKKSGKPQAAKQKIAIALSKARKGK